MDNDNQHHQTTKLDEQSQFGPLTGVEWNRPHTGDDHQLCLDTVNPVPSVEEGHKLEPNPHHFVSHRASEYEYDVTVNTMGGHQAFKFAKVYGCMTPDQLVRKMGVPLEAESKAERRDVRVYQNTKSFSPSCVIDPPCDVTIFDIRPASENAVIVSLRKRSKTISD